MISLIIAKKQIDRMMGLSLFPTSQIALKELARALSEISKSDDDAESIVTSWLRSNTVAPMPADLYRLGTPQTEGDYASKQIHRMKGLSYFPTDATAIEELEKTLRTVAHAEDLARQIVDVWMQVNRVVPTPSDLYDVAMRLADKSGYVDPNAPVCATCKNTYWKHVEGVVGVVRCHCFQVKAVSA